MPRSNLIADNLFPRRQLERAAECDGIGIGEFDALLGTDLDPVSDVHCAGELLDSIERSNDAARFVLDWEDESFKNAA